MLLAYHCWHCTNSAIHANHIYTCRSYGCLSSLSLFFAPLYFLLAWLGLAVSDTVFFPHSPFSRSSFVFCRIHPHIILFSLKILFHQLKIIKFWLRAISWKGDIRMFTGNYDPSWCFRSLTISSFYLRHLPLVPLYTISGIKGFHTFRTFTIHQGL